jgi:hypothetical protein
LYYAEYYTTGEPNGHTLSLYENPVCPHQEESGWPLNDEGSLEKGIGNVKLW